MQRALTLARQALYITSPNPRVGCVIVRDGKVLGEGHTQRAGLAHAEVVALGVARSAGHDVTGATVYVTLEPCNHFGRTAPCTEALISARIGRVIAAMEDPNPQVAGQGLVRLRAAGIDVRCGLLANEALELNPGFVKRMTLGLPWVRMKMASSLDGRSALPDGTSQWITGRAARTDGHHWRARACAVLTGIGTVLADDPQMNVRAVPTARQPRRIVLDSRLQTPPAARILTSTEESPGGAVTIAHALHDTDKQAVLQAQGAQVLHLPGENGQVDIAALLRTLASEGVNELHVEAGTRLNGAFLATGMVDELLLYIAPILVGEGYGLATLPSLSSLDAALRLKMHQVERIGDDLRVLARFIH